MLSYSQCNHLAQLPDGDGWALVNFANRGVVRLDATEKALFDIAPELSPALPLVQLWRNRGFLVDEELDEVALVRKQADCYHEDFVNGAAKRSLEIVVCVTSACNFACPYCFQDRRSGHMTSEVREAVVRFVERRRRRKRLD